MVQRPFPTQATSGAAAYEYDAGLRSYMLGIYNYMATGLAVSGLVAWLFARTALMGVLFSVTPEGGLAPNLLYYVAVFAPIGLILLMSFGAGRMSVPTLQVLYWSFVALMGVSLSTVLLVYTGASVIKTFLITAAAFAGLSLFGYTTKKDLTAMGSFMVMGLFGLLILMVVSWFFPGPMIEFMIALGGIVIFSGLTAWDTQRLKETYHANMDGTVAAKTSIMGAVSLYLNFINLFQFLLMFLGNRE